MSLEEYAKARLLTEIPHEMRLWHWTRSEQSARSIARRLQDSGDCTDLGQGIVGPGLYLSTSAVDLMDRGTNVLTAVMPAHTPVLMVDAACFSVGTPELFEIRLIEHDWAFRFPDPGADVEPGAGSPATDTVPVLMESLHVDVAVYIYGKHLACYVRSAAALCYDPEMDVVQTVADYAQKNPWDRPMLLAGNAVERWLAAHGRTI